MPEISEENILIFINKLTELMDKQSEQIDKLIEINHQQGILTDKMLGVILSFRPFRGLKK